MPSNILSELRLNSPAKPKITLIEGNICDLEVDAIVNTARPDLLGGGGVDGAIHKHAGRELWNECSSLGGCETGKAIITLGYLLPAKHVIHTVGPIYGRENGMESKLLTGCYAECIALADENKLSSIAFPSISTGSFGFPIYEAAKVVAHVFSMVIQMKLQFLNKIIMTTHSNSDYQIYKQSFIEKNLFD